MSAPKRKKADIVVSDGTYFLNMYNFSFELMNSGERLDTSTDDMILKGKKISDNLYGQQNLTINSSQLKISKMLGANEDVIIEV